MASDPLSPLDSNKNNEDPSNSRERPKAVSIAFWLIIGSAAVTAANYALFGRQDPIGPIAMTVIVTVVLGLAIRAGMNAARLIFAFLFAISIPAYFLAMHSQMPEGIPIFIGGAIVTLMQAYAVYLIFKSPGKYWFNAAKLSVNN